MFLLVGAALKTFKYQENMTEILNDKMLQEKDKTMSTPIWRNPKAYGLLGFILVAVPTLLFFIAGTSYSRVTPTEIGSREHSVTETVWEGPFNWFFLYFVIGASVASWGCYRSKLMAWAGSLFVLALSILAMFSIGLLTLSGAVFLLAGAALKTFEYEENIIE